MQLKWVPMTGTPFSWKRQDIFSTRSVQPFVSINRLVGLVSLFSFGSAGWYGIPQCVL
jgi:hypothetical protein